MMPPNTPTPASDVRPNGGRLLAFRRRPPMADRRERVTRSRGGVTTLMYAAQQGEVEKVRRIIEREPSSLFAFDRTGKSPLHYCSTSDNIRAAHAADLMVMAAPDLVDSRDEDGFTPLHLAVIAGNMQLVTFLLANGADVNAVDNEKHSVVHWATVCGETAALRAVLAARAPVSTPDVHGGYPLHYAAQMCGGEKDSNLGLEVLHTLLAHKDIEVTATDDDKRQPLLWASSAGSTRAVLALIRAGAAVEAADKDGLTALHCAASRGHTDCMDTLLTLCGASTDVIDSNGCTALHYAVTLGHADATALLLAHGADPNRQDRKGRSPAHCGCAKGQFETVKLIGSRGANLWLRNARGDLPLHDAAASGRRELVKWLLEMRPSQVNARNNDGRCPLHMAALNDNADMCKILLDAGAQINPVLRTSKNSFMTPLDCALQRGFRSTAKYLQLHGGIPATRIGDQRNQTNSALNLQIRDDITFWGDTSSDSERENGETTKNGKRVYRKKLSHKHERKKLSLSGSEKESSRVQSGKAIKKSSEKSGNNKAGSIHDSAASKKHYNKNMSSSRLDYSNEIIINGKTEINIHQTNEFIMDSEPRSTGKAEDQIVRSESRTTISEKERRPRSAKYSRTRDRSKSSSEKDIRKSAKTKAPSPGGIVEKEYSKKDLVLHDQSTNTSEETAETVIENKKSVPVPSREDTLHEEEGAEDILNGREANNKFHDQQSIISNTSEDVDEHRKEFIVEASVHAPPPISTDNTDQHEIEHVVASEVAAQNFPDVVADREQTLQDIINSAPPDNQIEDLSKTEMAAEESIAQDSKHEVNQEPLQAASDVEKNIISPAEVEERNDMNEESSSDALNKNIEASLSEELSTDAAKELPSSEELGMAATLEDNVNQTQAVEIPTEDQVNQSYVTQEPQAEETFLQEQLNKDITSNIPHDPLDSPLVSHDDRNDAVDKLADAIMESNIPLGDSIAKDTATEEELNKDIASNKKELFIKPEDVMPTNKFIEEETAEHLKAGAEISEKAKAGDKLEHKSKIAKYENNRSVKPNRKKVKEQKTSTTKTIRKQKSINGPKSEGAKVVPVHAKIEKRSVKSRKEDTLKGYSDDESSNLSDDSTQTQIENSHKSFRVLRDEDTRKLQKAKLKRVARQNSIIESRSRSEEMKTKAGSKDRENKTKRSKIPKPMFKSTLSKSDRYLYRPYDKDGVLDSRVPSLPNIHDDKFLTEPPRCESNMSAPLLASVYTDNERDSASEVEEQSRSLSKSKRLVKRRSRARESRSAGSDYESSNLIDSGFEPSPRSTRIPRWKNMSERGVNMTSVTQSIQTNIRRYHLERKIFQQLLELKRHQIRAGQHNEAVAVKRAIDDYHRSCASTVGAGRYVADDFTFKSFEKFLYEALRKLQKNGNDYMKGLPEAPTNPLHCTRSTNKCMHATHAYTGVPCAAYLPMMDHHSIPKIGFNDTVNCKPGTGFLPDINSKKAVTLELSNGTDKQVISLPTDRLDQNKRYYVTFTVKGNETSPAEEENNSSNSTGHRHSKSE